MSVGVVIMFDTNIRSIVVFGAEEKAYETTIAQEKR